MEDSTNGQADDYRYTPYISRRRQHHQSEGPHPPAAVPRLPRHRCRRRTGGIEHHAGAQFRRRSSSDGHCTACKVSFFLPNLTFYLRRCLSRTEEQRVENSDNGKRHRYGRPGCPLSLCTPCGNSIVSLLTPHNLVRAMREKSKCANA